MNIVFKKKKDRNCHCGYPNRGDNSIIINDNMMITTSDSVNIIK